MRKILVLAVSFLLLLSAYSLAQAQTYYPRVIEFKGVPDYSREELLAAAQLKPGAEMTGAQMRAHGKILLDTGLFSTLNYTFDGVNLIYHIAPAENLLPVKNANLPLPTGTALDALLRARLPLYRGKVPGEGGICEDVRAALQQMLSEQGVTATVEAAAMVGTDAAKTPAMNFSITDPPVKVGAISLNGAPAASFDEKLNKELVKIAGQPYENTATSTQIVAAVAAAYHNRAFVDAAVEIKMQPPAVDAAGIQIPFAVTVTTGKIYTLTGIELAPGLVMTQAEFDKMADLHEGDHADYRHVQSNLDALTFKYHNRGLMAAKIHAEPTLDRAKDQVRYRVTVEPGPVYTMGKVSVENVSDDLRRAMLAEWKLQAGVVFRESAVTDFYGTQTPALNRLYSNMNCRYTLTLNSEERTVDVKLRLERR